MYKIKFSKKIIEKSDINIQGYFLYKNYIYKILKTINSDTGLYYECSKISSNMFISKVYDNIDENEVKVELFYTAYNEERTIIMERECLCRNKISSLLKLGIDINDSNYVNVLEYLLESENQAEIIKTHSYLGWGTYNNTIIYKLHNCISCNDKPSSVYISNNDFIPKGTLNNWLSIINKEILGNTVLETILAIGFSSIIVPLLKDVSSFPVLYVHLFGDSSCGKSTSEAIAMSIFGNPSMTGSLCKRWVGTQNAFVNMFKNIYGFPVIIDESSAHNFKDLTSILYQITYGEDKQRLNKNAKLKATGKWSTTVISSGESSLLSQAKHNTGLQLRILELGGIQFTSSAKNADNLRVNLQNNYGTAAPFFVKWLMKKHPSENLKKHFLALRRVILKNSPKADKFFDRKSNQFAIIILSAILINHCFKMKLNIKNILDFLLENDSKNRPNQDIGAKALIFVKEYFLQNRNLFYKDNEYINSNTIGKYKVSEDMIEISILKNKLDNILKSNGFTDTNVVLSSWKKSGILNCESDRFTRTRKIGNVNSLVYVIRLKNPKENKKEKDVCINDKINYLSQFNN